MDTLVGWGSPISTHHTKEDITPDLQPAESQKKNNYDTYCDGVQLRR